MNTNFNVNGLPFWTEKEFKLREMMRDYFTDRIRESLRSSNPGWHMLQVEAPLLMPLSLVNKQYTGEDMFIFGDLVLRPETTPGTYQYARDLFDDTNSRIRPPVCIWQVGKSFRREQDQPSKHMRLKEFYQQEFQCIYTADSGNDYHGILYRATRNMIADMTGLQCAIVDSDRLPSYSRVTVDVEAKLADRQMEMASISLRTDFPGTVKFSKDEKSLLVAEVAIGLDRCVYAFLSRAS